MAKAVSLKTGTEADGFIRSPFRTVREYEAQFVREFNRNLSGAVSEVLKYIAHLTAAEIKQAKTDTK